MFNSKKIKDLQNRVSGLEMQLIALQNAVFLNEKLQPVSPAKAPKKRGRPAKKVETPTKRKYVKSGKYAKKVTTKKK